MARFHALLVAGLLTGAVACDNEPAKGKSQATVAAPVELGPAERPAGAVTYVFDDKTSDIEFVGAKVTRKHDGGFGSFRGTVSLVDGDPLKSSARVEIDTASLTSDEAKLTGHLKSPDFFDVEKFPKAIFTTTSIKAGGEKGASHTVTGNLELHGVTRSLTFPATITTSPEGVAVKAEFAIDRKDFGIVYPGAPDDLIKDDVLIKLALQARAKES